MSVDTRPALTPQNMHSWYPKGKCAGLANCVKCRMVKRTKIASNGHSYSYYETDGRAIPGRLPRCRVRGGLLDARSVLAKRLILEKQQNELTGALARLKSSCSHRGTDGTRYRDSRTGKCLGCGERI